MKRKFGVVILAAALIVSAGCLKKTFERVDARNAKESLEKYGPLENVGARSDHEDIDIPYAEGLPEDEFLTLDVYWNDHEGLQPMVVNIHGGAWEIGDKDDTNSLFRSKYLANHGYVVVNVNYRMLPKHPIQTQVNDVMGAVVWAKENAAKYGGDPDRVGVMGGSAGGHLAAMVAWASDDPYFVPTGHGDSEFDSDVKAAVLFYGVYDLEHSLARFPTDNKTGLGPIAYAYFTGTKGKDKRAQVFEHISPIDHLSPDLPPSYIVCGDEDNFELYPESVRIHELLKEEGVPTGLYTAKGAVHGFDRAYGEDYSIEAMEKTKEWFDRYLK